MWIAEQEAAAAGHSVSEDGRSEGYVMIGRIKVGEPTKSHVWDNFQGGAEARNKERTFIWVLESS